jgi:hypothetical protein
LSEIVLRALIPDEAIQASRVNNDSLPDKACQVSKDATIKVQYQQGEALIDCKVIQQRFHKATKQFYSYRDPASIGDNYFYNLAVTFSS